MKPMNPASARALIGLAVLLMIVGWMIISPAGSFFAFLAAAVSALSPAIFGRGRARLVAASLLLAALSSAAIKFPEFSQEQMRYQKHLK